jgi:hypothetical protein
MGEVDKAVLLEVLDHLIPEGVTLEILQKKVKQNNFIC